MENLSIKLQVEIGRLQLFINIILRAKRFITNLLKGAALKGVFLQLKFLEKVNEPFMPLVDLTALHLALIANIIYIPTLMN